jgi:ubiquinone/menaquinone biosynthesis C-methylase UbiE
VVLERWALGDAYEAYVGRWSRVVATEFVRWLDVAPDVRWLDVGCGTGALSATVLRDAAPAAVVAVDPSAGFLRTARAGIADPRVAFAAADARAVPLADGAVGAVVSGLVLNFVPDAARAVAELARVTAPGGTVAAYVWDYAEGMEFMRLFWDAAAELDPDTGPLD